MIVKRDLIDKIFLGLLLWILGMVALLLTAMAIAAVRYMLLGGC